jgi:hypothetical protein
LKSTDIKVRPRGQVFLFGPDGDSTLKTYIVQCMSLSVSFGWLDKQYTLRTTNSPDTPSGRPSSNIPDIARYLIWRV